MLYVLTYSWPVFALTDANTSMIVFKSAIALLMLMPRQTRLLPKRSFVFQTIEMFYTRERALNNKQTIDTVKWKINTLVGKCVSPNVKNNRIEQFKNQLRIEPNVFNVNCCFLRYVSSVYFTKVCSNHYKFFFNVMMNCVHEKGKPSPRILHKTLGEF